MSLTQPAEALKTVVSHDLIPAGAWAEADVYERELAQIFSRFWMPVGRVEELIDTGGYFTWERTRIPTVMIRSVDQRIRGFYNSCRHRGAPVVRTPTGRGRAFRCQYHSWTYDTFGKLMSIPDERDFGNIDRCAHSLVSLRLAELGGWLWIDQSGKAPELAEALGALHPWLEERSACHFGGRHTVAVDANWKSVVAHLSDATGVDAPHFPNIFFSDEGEGLRMFAAWPRDERTTEVELVICPVEGGDAPGAEAMEQMLRDTLSGLSPSVEPGAAQPFAKGFAGQWSRAMSADL